MILVVLIVFASAAAGVTADRNSSRAQQASQLCLNAMFYALVPYVAFVNFAHLTLSLGAALGLAAAWVGLLVGGGLAYAAGRALHLPPRSHGALMIAVMIVNTGYLGYPVSVALLGQHALVHAVAYDQIVSTPIAFTVGFALAARFGDSARAVQQRSSGPFRALVRSPPLWAAAVGLIGGPTLAPHVLVLVGDKVVDAFLVLGFFAVGVALSSERRAEQGALFQLPDRPVLVALALRFSVTIAGFGLLVAAGLSVPHAYLLQAVMPSGVIGLMIAHAYGLDQRLLTTAILWSTLAVLLVATVASLV